MISLPEYTRIVHDNINCLGGNGDVVYTAACSSAMICSYNLVVAYTNISKRKNPPIPISVTNKATDTGAETYTCFKFSASDINLNTLNKVIQSCGFNNIQVIEYGSTVNLEIYL